MRLEECFEKLREKIPSTVDEKYNSFYEFIDAEFNDFIETLRSVDEKELLPILKNELSKDYKTTEPFITLMVKICTFIKEKILKEAYRGNIYQATTNLLKLLYYQKYTEGKLKDMYVNYFDFKITDENATLYRVRTIKQEESDTDCNHLPFDKREKADNGRFSLNQYPCLYLADSKDTAIAETITPKSDSNENSKDSKLLIGKFNENRKGKTLLGFFYLGKPESFQNCKNRSYDIFKFLVTYPMSLVCLSTKKSGHIEKFESEYLIPQILFSILFHDVDEAKRGFKGIAYSSTQADGINYAIPALMPKDKILFKNHSTYIKDLLTQYEYEINNYKIADADGGAVSQQKRLCLRL